MILPLLNFRGTAIDRQTGGNKDRQATPKNGAGAGARMAAENHEKNLEKNRDLQR